MRAVCDFDLSRRTGDQETAGEQALSPIARVPGPSVPLFSPVLLLCSPRVNGGGGIRTPGALSRTTVFKTVPFSRSGTPPVDFCQNTSLCASPPRTIRPGPWEPARTRLPSPPSVMARSARILSRNAGQQSVRAGHERSDHVGRDQRAQAYRSIVPGVRRGTTELSRPGTATWTASTSPCSPRASTAPETHRRAADERRRQSG